VELEKLEVNEKEIKDEAAVRVASMVYVWDGTKGVLFDADVFVEMKKRFETEVREIEGVSIAILTKEVKEPDWKAIYAQRMKDQAGKVLFYEKVATFRRHDKGITKARLVSYYERGRMVDELQKEPGKYGNETVKKFAAELGISPDSVYQYHRFFCLYKDQRVLDLSKKNMEWATVTQLLGVKTEKERAKIEDAYIEGKLDDKQLSAAIKKARRSERAEKEARGEKVDRRGGPGIARIFKGTGIFADKMQDKLAEFSEAYKAFMKLPDDDRKKELKAALRTTASSLSHLHKRLTKLVGEPQAKEAPKEKEAEKAAG
jgi:vacuolar-type H+-ATPase subunit I/STV1